ncbi:superfamily I DNA/RNA helicase [Brevibacterium sanguinis]|uniref:DNA 3'-5' helicase n=3 Tax=Brevibacteriaceae TaxID=85019 RepID=A0A366INN1_9MICO|nr:superfamily I DNA/RNA helicase [Brevibacterium sanguinis]RBP72959.1 superfamily I DNA/RNA helicase [Brevibacterium celere]
MAATTAARLRARESVTIIGRPGTGKTTLLEVVYASLVGEVSPAEVLVLTPNRAHAADLRDRLPVPAEAVLSSAPARSISSYAFGIARAAHSTRTGDDLGFVSGADQDVILADLLAGHELGRGSAPVWPGEITAEVRATSAFRTEVRDALNRIMEFDFGVRLPPAEDGHLVFDSGRSAIRRVLARHRDPRWEALSRILDEYLGIMSMPGYGGVDSATVLARAAFEVLREPADVTAGRPWSFAPEPVPSVVLVDAAQDLPAAAWGLLEQLQERGCALALFGSPETVTGRFHGADASILDRSVHSGRFTTLVLGEVRRVAPELVAVGDDIARRITTRWGLGHIPRTAGSDDAQAEAASVETHVFSSSASEHRYLARRIAGFVEDGHRWSDVAVVCRTTSTARVLASELRASGIVTEHIVSALSIDPATAPLLGLLERAPDFDDDASIAALALSLAGSVYVRLDAVQLRRFRRLVRRRYPAADSTASLAEALRAGPAESGIAGLETITRMLVAASEHSSADPHQALWAIWEAAQVAERWQAEALRDPESDANAHLDAVLRLFTLAEKIAERGGFTARSFAGIVAEQDIAQDSLAATAGFDDVVHIGTPASLAHRRYGMVVVAEVNDGVWPNPKLRGGILGLTDLAAALDTGTTVTADAGYHSHAKRTNLREEGELFYTALTRADDHVLVTAVADDQTGPSPFFDLLAARRGAADSEDGYVLTHEDELPPLSVTEMAAHARARLLEAAAAGDEPGDEARPWVRLLRALGDADPTLAGPAAWRETEDVSSSAPLCTDDDTVRVSPSQVEAFDSCSLRWFLTRNGGDRPGGVAQSLGTILHAAAERFPTGPTSAIRDFVDAEFATLDYSAEWERARDHALAMSMVDRLGEYILNAPGEVLGVEAQVNATGVDDEGREWAVTGRLDRIEATDDGVRIVDFKTGRTVAAGADMARHAQLGVYQEAINSGTITLPDGRVIEARAQGAELVYLRNSSRTVREQAALEADSEPDWARRLLAEVSTGMRAAEFPATVDPSSCRSCPVRSSCPAVGPRLMEEG